MFAGSPANLARASAFFITSTGTTPRSNDAPDVASLISSGVPANLMSSLCPLACSKRGDQLLQACGHRAAGEHLELGGTGGGGERHGECERGAGGG